MPENPNKTITKPTQSKGHYCCVPTNLCGHCSLLHNSNLPLAGAAAVVQTSSNCIPVDWRNNTTPAMRVQRLQQFVRALFVNDNEERMVAVYDRAESLERELFETSANANEYHRLLAEQFQLLHKELQEPNNESSRLRACQQSVNAENMENPNVQQQRRPDAQNHCTCVTPSSRTNLRSRFRRRAAVYSNSQQRRVNATPATDLAVINPMPVRIINYVYSIDNGHVQQISAETLFSMPPNSSAAAETSPVAAAQVETGSQRATAAAATTSSNDRNDALFYVCIYFDCI